MLHGKEVMSILVPATIFLGSNCTLPCTMLMHVSAGVSGNKFPPDPIPLLLFSETITGQGNVCSHNTIEWKPDQTRSVYCHESLA